MTKVNEPTVAYIIMEDGEKIDCLLEKVADDEWQATAVKDVDIMNISQFYVELIPGRS